MVNCEELVGTTVHVMFYTRCRLTNVVITKFDCSSHKREGFAWYSVAWNLC
jgi:hypothetical protein